MGVGIFEEKICVTLLSSSMALNNGSRNKILVISRTVTANTRKTLF